MRTLKSFFVATVLMISLLSTSTYPATFDIHNNCRHTVWAAAVPTGGGKRLDRGQTWTINVPAGSHPGLIWARTNCTFNTNGRGSRQTGVCGGVLNCTADGAPPNALAGYSISQFNNLDFLDITLVHGFNVPIELSRPTNSCSGGISCSADLNEQCPDEPRAPGGCNNPCTVFNTYQFCCTSGEDCGPTIYSRYFKERCPHVDTYPMDDQNNTFTCPGGSNYRVVFCP